MSFNQTAEYYPDAHKHANACIIQVNTKQLLSNAGQLFHLIRCDVVSASCCDKTSWHRIVKANHIYK